jgi:uncharacterized membrane protein
MIFRRPLSLAAFLRHPQESVAYATVPYAGGSRQIPGNHPNSVMTATSTGRVGVQEEVMGHAREGQPDYACILEVEGGGPFWVSVQLPTGRLSRGPYGDRYQALAAASVLDKVAQRPWNRDSGGTPLDLRLAPDQV